jgi:prevent-host-death family protein
MRYCRRRTDVTALRNETLWLEDESMIRKGAEEARNQLSALLEAAERGESTIITRHGRPVAALVPIATCGAAVRQEPLTPVVGSGRGLWGKDSTRTIQKLRDEWSR